MLAKRARHLTRLYEMFYNATELVNTGKQYQRMSDDERLTFREDANPKSLRLLELHDKLVELEPSLFEKLCRTGPHAHAASRHASACLANGQSNGRSEDMRKVREALPHMQVWDPPLGDKSTRGLAHRTTAYYLSDPNLDFNNEQDVLQFMAYHNPPMTASVWPRFLWFEGKHDPDRMSIGLLRGELLILVPSRQVALVEIVAGGQLA
ncbi:hypothetical protein RSOL_191920, partial [Rhizoctonia solani AG-3 Rhs1AP]